MKEWIKEQKNQLINTSQWETYERTFSKEIWEKNNQNKVDEQTKDRMKERRNSRTNRREQNKLIKKNKREN